MNTATSLSNYKYVHVLPFGENETPEGPITAVCGVHVDKTNPRSHLHIFEISENESEMGFSDNLLKGCVAVLAQTHPGADVCLSDVDWTFTNSPFNADFKFMPLGQGGYLLTRTANSLGGGGSSFAACQYEEALNDSQGFEKAITGGHSFYGSGEIVHTAIIPAPLHPDGYYLMGAERGNYPSLLVDSKKFFDSWLNQSFAETGCQTLDGLAKLYNANARIMGGDDNPVAPFHSDLSTALSHMNCNHFQFPQEMPLVSYTSDQDMIEFTNGRHRTINLIKAGAPYVPVQYAGHPKDLAAFSDKFEYRHSPDRAWLQKMQTILQQTKLRDPYLE